MVLSSKIHRFVCGGVITLVLTLCFAPSLSAAAPKWEPVNAANQISHPALAEAMDAEKFDVCAQNNFIFIYAPKAENVKVFSILGQLICEANVQAGVSRLRIPSRGIYILKTGSTTRRVTI